MQEDIVIGYRGGSGGFLLLHLILLSGQYHLTFQDDKPLRDIIKFQWEIADPVSWKDREIWPNPVDTVASNQSGKPNVFFLCNPTKQGFLHGQDEILIDGLIKGYSDIKDQSWPDIKSVDDYNNLPDVIRYECEKIHCLPFPGIIRRIAYAKKIWLYTDSNSQNELAFYKKAYLYYQKKHLPKKTIASAWFQGRLVDHLAIDCATSSNCVIFLQDFLNDLGVLVKQNLILSVNQNQIDLVRHWKSLHPKNLLTSIGVIA